MTRSTDKPTVLLTLGRLPVCLELARALHGGGWRVVVADSFAWHLCRLSNVVSHSYQVQAPSVDAQTYQSQLIEIIEREAVNLVLPVSEESMYVSALYGLVPSTVTLLCMDQPTLLMLHDKYRFARFAQLHSLNVPATELADDHKATMPLLTSSFVVKPRFSCSGAGVRIADSGGALDVTEQRPTHIVQKRLRGRSCCSFCIAASGQVLVSVCYQSKVESGSVSVCFEQITMPDRIAAFIAKVVNETQFSGMISFDFIQDEKGVWNAIECNPRATSGLHFVPHEQLLRALIAQQDASTPPPTAIAKEFWSCLAALQGKLLKGKIDKPGWSAFFKSKDITWRWSDNKPFLLMSFILAPVLINALRTGRPVSELLMDDVSWHEH